MGNRYRIKCVTIGDYDDVTEEWPEYLSVEPREGSYVTARSGRTLQILSLSHTTDDKGLPIIVLEIGKKKSTDVTPTEGGVAGEGFM